MNFITFKNKALIITPLWRFQCKCSHNYRKLHLDAKKNIAISFRKRKKELGMYRLGAKDLYYLPLVNGIKRSKNGNKEICYFS